MQMPPSLPMIRLVSAGRIEVEVGGEDLCSLAGEEHRRRLAVALALATRAGSRNQRYFPLEPIAHALLPWQLTGRLACAQSTAMGSDNYDNLSEVMLSQGAARTSRDD